MKSEAAFSTFHYHACAHAFSGRFTRPFDHLIDVQAATSLPVIGGHGSTRHTDMLLTFGEACGATRDQLTSARKLPSTRALTDWGELVSLTAPFPEAVAGITVGTEGPVPGFYGRILPALRGHYGFTEPQLINF